MYLLCEQHGPELHVCLTVTSYQSKSLLKTQSKKCTSIKQVQIKFHSHVYTKSTLITFFFTFAIKLHLMTLSALVSTNKCIPIATLISPDKDQENLTVVSEDVKIFKINLLPCSLRKK